MVESPKSVSIKCRPIKKCNSPFLSRTIFSQIPKLGFSGSSMAGGNFLHRVMTYVANELVVNGLANSPSFQRFAVRTSRKIEDISKMAAKTKQEVSEKVKDGLKNFESLKDQ